VHEVLHILRHERWLDPVHENFDRTWWFWDETWGNEIGPYLTEDEAREALNKYAKEYLGE
jgi:hypothetical protein